MLLLQQQLLVGGQLLHLLAAALLECFPGWRQVQGLLPAS
jgi:hypothetical protein